MKSISIGSAQMAAAVRSPGFWLLVGGLEVLFMIHISEFLYPGYSVSDNYISELGVGPMLPSIVFAAGVILYGATAIIAAYLFRRDDRKSWIWRLLVLCGIGAVGVGAFNMEDARPAHAVSALMAFLFANLSVLYSRKMVRPPLNYVFIVLGLMGLSALVLFGAGAYLGLGVGGMERMILYPAMFWAVCFGACLLASESRSSRT